MTEDDAAVPDRYRSITTDGDGVIVYDREEPEAWLQSSYAVEVGPADRRRA